VKRSVASLLCLSLLSFSSLSSAVPVLYQFHASGPGLITGSNTELLSLLGATNISTEIPSYYGYGFEYYGHIENIGLNGTFIFDNALNTPSSSSNILGFVSGPYSAAYENAASNFNGTVSGISFTTDSKQGVVVYNDFVVTNPWVVRDFVRTGGEISNGTQLGRFTLTGVSLSWPLGGALLVNDTALPVSLELLSSLRFFQLTFVSESGESAYVGFYDVSLAATTVPVPAALPLMISAMAGLFGLHRLRKK
jgi:hypothetical protein